MLQKFLQWLFGAASPSILSVPEQIWSTQLNLDVHGERESGQYLRHFQPTDAPLSLAPDYPDKPNHYYYPDDINPRDAYFRVLLPEPIQAGDGKTYTQGWVTGRSDYVWRVRFTAPAPVPPPPPPGPYIVGVIELYSDGSLKGKVP